MGYDTAYPGRAMFQRIEYGDIGIITGASTSAPWFMIGRATGEPQSKT